MKQKTMKDMFRLSFKEEVANSISHGVMAMAFLCVLPYISIYSYEKGGLTLAIGTSVYGICIFLMFLISTIYHSMQYGSGQKFIFRKLDHICIFLAIAGTYTPIALYLIEGWQGTVILIIQWSVVLIGVLYKSISSKSLPILSMTLYLAMGWTAVFFLPVLLQKASATFLSLIVAGGVMYTIGAYFYSHPERKYSHFVWHLFINFASILHFIAVIYCM